MVLNDVQNMSLIKIQWAKIWPKLEGGIKSKQQNNKTKKERHKKTKKKGIKESIKVGIKKERETDRMK